MRLFCVLVLSLFLACDSGAKSKPAPRAEPSAETGASAAGAADAGVKKKVMEVHKHTDPQPFEPPPPEFKGTIRGIVKLAPGVELPLARPPKMSGQPATSAAPCPPVDENDQRLVARSEATGGVSPVHVALTQMTAAETREPRTHELFIDGCRLRPTMIGTIRGDKVRVTNRSDAPLLPVLPGDRLMTGMTRGESREFTIESTGTLPIRCEVGSFCGQSLVVGVSHPLQAITDDQGRFTIENVPLDQMVMVNAWHPLFKPVSTDLTLSKEQPEQTIELLLEPSAIALTTADAGKKSAKKTK